MRAIAIPLLLSLVLSACSREETDAVIEQQGRAFTCTTADGQSYVVRHDVSDAFSVYPNGGSKRK